MFCRQSLKASLNALFNRAQRLCCRRLHFSRDSLERDIKKLCPLFWAACSSQLCNNVVDTGQGAGLAAIKCTVNMNHLRNCTSMLVVRHSHAAVRLRIHACDDSLGDGLICSLQDVAIKNSIVKRNYK